MTEFKVGDKVRCIDHLGTFLEENKEYTVSKVYTKYEEQLAFLQVEGGSGGWFPTRFELVEEEKPKPMIIEFRVGQTYKTSTNNIVTVTAVGETKLLAKTHAGNEFEQYITNVIDLWTEYVKPIEVGSKVRLNHLELIVTAIHGDYAWCHTANNTNMHGGPGGMIMRLDKLKAL